MRARHSVFTEQIKLSNIDNKKLYPLSNYTFLLAKSSSECYRNLGGIKVDELESLKKLSTSKN